MLQAIWPQSIQNKVARIMYNYPNVQLYSLVVEWFSHPKKSTSINQIEFAKTVKTHVASTAFDDFAQITFLLVTIVRLCWISTPAAQ